MKKKYNYYIEIRYVGKLKQKIEAKVNKIRKIFNLPKNNLPPHTTIIQPFNTKQEKRLISDFKKICLSHKEIPLNINKWGSFGTHTIFTKVESSKELVNFRKELLNAIREYCDIILVDIPFKPHITIAWKLNKWKFCLIKIYTLFSRSIRTNTKAKKIRIVKNKKTLFEWTMK